MPTRLLLDGPDIESLLARVQDEHGESARIVHAEKVRSGGLGGFFARERYEVSVEVPDPAAPTGSLDRPDDAMPAALLLADSVEDSLPRTAPATPSAPPPAVSTSSSAFTEVLESIRSGMGSPAPVPTSRSFVPATPAPAAGPARVVPAAPAPASSYPAASSYGPAMPMPLRPGERKPPRAPRHPGAIVVLVGEGATAYDAAVDLARTLRLDPTGIHVAAPAPVVKVPASKRIADPVTARLKAAKLLTAPTASIVVVDLPLGADPDWSRDVIDGLGAAAVWAVVDATRKIADLHRWTQGVRRIDALVVHHAAVTEDATSVRALGIPVALLDGRTATASAWRSIGCEPPDGLA